MNSLLVFQKPAFVLCFKPTLFAAKNYSFVFCACVHPKVWLSSGFEIAFFTSKCLSIMLWGSVFFQCIFWTCLMSTFHKEKWFPRAWRLCEFSMHFLNLPYAHTFHKKNDSLVFFLNVCVQITKTILLENPFFWFALFFVGRFLAQTECYNFKLYYSEICMTWGFQNGMSLPW